MGFTFEIRFVYDRDIFEPKNCIRVRLFSLETQHRLVDETSAEIYAKVNPCMDEGHVMMTSYRNILAFSIALVSRLLHYCCKRGDSFFTIRSHRLCQP